MLASEIASSPWTSTGTFSAGVGLCLCGLGTLGAPRSLAILSLSPAVCVAGVDRLLCLGGGDYSMGHGSLTAMPSGSRMHVVARGWPTHAAPGVFPCCVRSGPRCRWWMAVARKVPGARLPTHIHLAPSTLLELHTETRTVIHGVYCTRHIIHGVSSRGVASRHAPLAQTLVGATHDGLVRRVMTQGD